MSNCRNYDKTAYLSNTASLNKTQNNCNHRNNQQYMYQTTKTKAVESQ